ncbi:monovalent cation/H+ antiporter subunit A [Porphyrobacter sp. GA68]|uniref:monovalent cation/H+ antiporter subunit A n=1 Tax=Porphyrobacter sp. GA68 TaxID=2883480 RepID=UPI001D186705|nr:monovalent cation/H+ antiporter subunit A [Porphyrobacter sp. GA68]
MGILLLSVLPFLGALLVACLHRTGRNGQALTAITVTSAALALLLFHTPGVMAGEVPTARFAWVPAAGLAANFFLDPLGLLFAGLILGIGLLIVIYARFYLAADDPMGRFYVFLLLFQGAMLGIVLSDNILLLIVFWEMTSITSFLLIGYWRHLPEARQGARMALVVTGGGGLALLAGMLILGSIAGSYDLTTILGSREIVQASPLYPLALALILLGCFTKSAQFPFHFWLPHAMAAPTPVSAYLHSATMVKAGVFLLARLWPVLAGTDMWFYSVATVGLVTMLVGAAIAVFKNDLKAILAYSTVSQLGLLTMLLGFGTPMAAMVAVFHIINHATFKAALFMTAGIIDHETGTRDVRRLGGLLAVMPITATIAGVAAASMAGFPPLNGFISKEMMLEQAWLTTWGGFGGLVALLATVAAALSVAYSLRLFVHVFMGKSKPELPQAPHDPPAGLWLPPAFLAFLVVAIGLLPALIAGPLVQAVSGAVIGFPPPLVELKLWHGFNPALFLSIAAIVAGALMLRSYRGLEPRWRTLPTIEAKTLFDKLVAAIVAGATWVTAALHNASLQRTLVVFFGTAIVLGTAGIIEGGGATGARATLPASPVAVAAWLALVGAALAVTLGYRERFLSLIFISVIGLVIALGFVHLSAPDLALTQISVEVVTILLLLLALNLLPKTPRQLSSARRHLRDAAVGVAGGGALGYSAWLVMTRDPNNPISAFHWANSYAGGGGTNVVNVTLVDFRAFDTFGEIIVLGIAALTIFALLDTAVRGASGRRLLAWVPDLVRSPERHPMMFVIATRLLLPFAMAVAIFLFLRGHNLPGGGFIAGLVVSIALLMQFMASGYEWADRRRSLDEHRMIAWGVLVASLTGAGAALFGVPFFTTGHDYFAIPLIGEVHLATALLFDLGVVLAVVGAVTLALAELSNVAQRAERLEKVDHPMDIDPSRGPEDRA